MNLGELKRMLDESFMRSDLEHNYVPWINRACRKIQQDEDWGPMRETAVLSFSAGDTSKSLPERFKSLTPERYAIHVRKPGDTGVFPCELVTYEKLKKLRSTTFSPPVATNQFGPRYGVPVFIEPDGDGFLLCLPVPASEAMEFLVSHYAFTPDLEQDSDSNFLTRQYEDLVENRVKSIAFARVNDHDMVGILEQFYRGLLKEAKVDDFRRFRQGRALRMGG